MALETGTYISSLVASNPPQSDSLTQSAGHLRLLKSTLLATFPNVTGAVTATHTQIDAAVTAVTAAQFLPAGSMLDFAGATLPTGYLWCNGASYLRADYATLFTAIGTAHGAVDGTHFSVPNCKDRFRVGKADMGATTDAAIIDSLLTSTTLGATYDGEGAIDTITLALTNIPAHTHTFSGSGTTSIQSANHTHSVSGNTGSDGSHTHGPGGGSNFVDDSNSTTASAGSDRTVYTGRHSTTDTESSHNHSFSATSGLNSVNHTHSVTISGTSDSSGSTTAFTVDILPPSIVCNVIIKT